MMPFKSKAQARLMYATNPKIASEMSSKTKNWKDLPERAKVRKEIAKKKKRG